MPDRQVKASWAHNLPAALGSNEDFGYDLGSGWRDLLGAGRYWRDRAFTTGIARIAKLSAPIPSMNDAQFSGPVRFLERFIALPQCVQTTRTP